MSFKDVSNDISHERIGQEWNEIFQTVEFAVMVRVIAVFAIVAAATAATTIKDERLKLRDRSKRFILTPLDSTRIQEGFNVGKQLADLMVEEKFSGTRGAIVESAKKYFGAINPYFGLALSLARGPTPELQLLRQLFTRMEEQFNQVDIQFDQLRKQVAFVPAQVHLNDWKHNIKAVEHQLMMLTKVENTTSYEYAKAEFIRAYHGTYESAGIKLYNSIMEGGPTSGGLFQEFSVFRSHNRNETQKFMLGIMNLMMEASTLELTYATLNNDPNYAHTEADWNQHIVNIKNKAAAMDDEKEKNYKNYMSQEFTTFETQNRGQTNADFSKGLYKELTEKFYWRDWIVVIGGAVSSLVVHSCDIQQHDNHGRSIMVASVDKAKEPTDIDSAKRILIDAASGLNWNFFSHPNNWFNAFPDEARSKCTNFTQAGVHSEGKHFLSINHAVGRFAEYSSGYRFYHYGWLFG